MDRATAQQVNDGATKLWAKMDVPLDADQMEVKQVWYESKDGTKIPMFLTYKKDVGKGQNYKLTPRC